MVGRNLPPAANREAIGVLSKVTNRIIVELDIATRTGSSQGKRRLQWQTSLCIGIFFLGGVVMVVVVAGGYTIAEKALSIYDFRCSRKSGSRYLARTSKPCFDEQQCNLSLTPTSNGLALVEKFSECQPCCSLASVSMMKSSLWKIFISFFSI